MMFGRCGRMTPRARLSAELEQSGLVWTVALGVGSALSAVFVRVLTGSPHRIILELGIGAILPPVWFFSLLRFLSFFIVGSAAGFLIGSKRGGKRCEKDRAALCFLLLLICELGWYPILFGAGLPFLSMLLALVAFLLGILCVIRFSCVSLLSALVMGLHTVWLFYLFCLSVSIFFRV